MDDLKEKLRCLNNKINEYNRTTDILKTKDDNDEFYYCYKSKFIVLRHKENLLNEMGVRKRLCMKKKFRLEMEQFKELKQ